MAEFTLSFSLDSGGFAEGKGIIEKESLTLSPSIGDPLRLPLRDIESIAPSDYKVAIRFSGGSAVVSGLGYKYEDFVRELCLMRNEAILKDMLMEDALKMGQVRCDYSLASEGKETKGACEVRVYGTSLVVLPDSGELARMPFCEISEARQEGYALIIEGEYGDRLALSALGRHMDPLRKAISDAMGALSARAQEILKEAAPEADPLAISKAARLMRDGRAARRADLDGISPAIWEGLVKRIDAAGLGKEYAILESLSAKGQMCVGVKRSLMGDMEGEYIWILAPLKDKNVIALEATSAEESGRATYLFKARETARIRSFPTSGR